MSDCCILHCTCSGTAQPDRSMAWTAGRRDVTRGRAAAWHMQPDSTAHGAALQHGMCPQDGSIFLSLCTSALPRGVVVFCQLHIEGASCDH